MREDQRKNFNLETRNDERITLCLFHGLEDQSKIYFIFSYKVVHR